MNIFELHKTMEGVYKNNNFQQNHQNLITNICNIATEQFINLIMLCGEKYLLNLSLPSIEIIDDVLLYGQEYVVEFEWCVYGNSTIITMYGDKNARCCFRIIASNGAVIVNQREGLPIDKIDIKLLSSVLDVIVDYN